MGGTNGCVAASVKTHVATWPQSDSAGRNTSVDQPTSDLTIGRSVSISCRQPSHDQRP